MSSIRFENRQKIEELGLGLKESEDIEFESSWVDITKYWFESFRDLLPP